MKRNSLIFISTMFILLLLFTGCNQQPEIDMVEALSKSQELLRQKDDNNEFFVYAHNENMNDELRESLFKCLNTEEIEYRVDNDKNVLIKKKDSDLAVARCS